MLKEKELSEWEKDNIDLTMKRFRQKASKERLAGVDIVGTCKMCNR